VRRSRKLWWTLYAVGALLSLAALGWISGVLLGLEAEKHVAQHEADQASAVRLALWRMDSWLGPQLAREAARPYFEYRAFVPNERAYTRLLHSIEAGEVLQPSPLLTFESDLFPIHFQLDEQGTWSSPQVPTGNLLDLAQAGLVDDLVIANKSALFSKVRKAISPTELLGAMDCRVEGLNDLILPAETAGEDWTAESAKGWQAQAKEELSQRVATNIATQNFLNNPRLKLAGNSPQALAEISHELNTYSVGRVAGAQILVGPLLPVWLAEDAGTGPLEICFVRRVEVGTGSLLQGFACNWELLRETLLGQVTGLFPAAQLQLARATLANPQNMSRLLATLPAELEVSFPALAQSGRWTPARATLGITWLAALLGLAGLAFSLHASITYGEKRSRFASSVTHELRTPLTTFRMYTEMLAQGMVPEEKRQEYFKTLHSESNRLSHLVESVLTYARLEDGRAQLARERMLAADLIERASETPGKRAQDFSAELGVNLSALPEAWLETDAGAVEQILFNLVDNACKYGRGAGLPLVELSARVTDSELVILVSDNGPGVPANLGGAIFKPFDRGRVQAADPRPGIGLGLALSRGLARDLGGELELLPGTQPGACFRLRLPLSS